MGRGKRGLENSLSFEKALKNQSGIQKYPCLEVDPRYTLTKSFLSPKETPPCIQSRKKEHPFELKVLKLNRAQISNKNIGITGNCLMHPVKIFI